MTIAIIGPESTGKTTLCEALSKHFGCKWIAEYARTYVEQLGRPYTYADVEQIAKKQVEQLRDYQKNSKNKLVLLDTDLIITKVWFAHVYGRMPEWLDHAIAEQKIDLYLLLRPDIAWEYDPVRENGDKREFFYDWYKREIEQTGVPFAEIGGFGSQRTQNAIEAIENFGKIR